MQERKTLWMKIKDTGETLKNFALPAAKLFKKILRSIGPLLVKLFKNAFDFIASLSEILKNAPQPFTKFVMFVGSIARNPTVKLALGFITPILATIDLVCNIYELNSLRDEAQKILRMLPGKEQEQARKDFNIKQNKQLFRTYKAALVTAFACLTSTYGVIKYALQLSALATPAVPYLVFASLIFSYLSVITLVIFTIMELGALIKDFVDMYRGNDDKGRKFREEILGKLGFENTDEKWNSLKFNNKWLSALKFFVTQGFALEMFSIACASVAILVAILLLAGIVSVPVAGMIAAAIFTTLPVVKITDITVRKVVTKYNERFPSIREPTSAMQKSFEVYKKEQIEKETNKETEEKTEELGTINKTTQAPTLTPGSSSSSGSGKEG
jgi:hypothetical protein